MKQHTTNYFDTFIEVAEDCPVSVAQELPLRDPKTATRIEYEMAVNSPYAHTSDDIVYESNGRRRGVNREAFFSKGQPCCGHPRSASVMVGASTTIARAVSRYTL